MADTPIHGAPDWISAQASPWLVENKAKRMLEAMARRGVVQDRDLSDPPGSCSDGDCYLIAGGAGGDWATHDGEMAIAVGDDAASGWYFITVTKTGTKLFVVDEDVEIKWSGSAWVLVSDVAGLSDLPDVDITGIGDGYILRYDESNEIWYASVGLDSFIAQLDDIGDVDAPAPSEGDALIFDFDSQTWIAGKPTVSLNDLADVDTSGLMDGYVLTYDESNGGFYAMPGSGDAQTILSTLLEGIADDGSAISFNHGVWEAVSTVEQGYFFGTLLDAGDIVSNFYPFGTLIDAAYSNTPGSILFRDASVWNDLPPGSEDDVLTISAGLPSWQPPAVATVSSLDDIGDVSVSTAADGNVLKYDASNGLWYPAEDLAGVASLSLDDLTNVDEAGKADGDALVYNSGSQTWVPGSAGASTLNGLDDVDTSGAADGTPLIYDVSNGLWYPGPAIEFRNPLENIYIACSDEATAITTGTAKRTMRMPYGFNLEEVRLNVTTAPTGADLIVDVNLSGASIFSTRVRIDAGEKTSKTAATAAVLSTTYLGDDAEITVDFDQVGSTVAGAGVKVVLIGRRA